MLGEASLLDTLRALAAMNEPRSAVAALIHELSVLLLDTVDHVGTQRTDRRNLANDLELFATWLRHPDEKPRTLRAETDLLRARLVCRALEAARYNVAQAARSLGVSRNLIYSVIAPSDDR